MGPGVVPNAPHDVRIHLHLLANEEERALDVALLQKVQQLRRKAGMWTIVKGHRQGLLRDLDGGVRDASPRWRHDRHGGRVVQPLHQRVFLLFALLRDRQRLARLFDSEFVRLCSFLSRTAGLSCQHDAKPNAEVHAWGNHNMARLRAEIHLRKLDFLKNKQSPE